MKKAPDVQKRHPVLILFQSWLCHPTRGNRSNGQPFFPDLIKG